MALRDAIADELGIASDEMGFGVRLDKDMESGRGRSVIQVFDQMSGGAGFVLAGLSDVVGLLQKVRAKLDCQADCENVCSICLAGKDSRVEFSELNRKQAREWLDNSEYLKHLALPASVSNISGVTYCSVGPSRFLRSAIDNSDKSDSSRVLQIALRGDFRDWDLGHPKFRDAVLTWQIVDKVQVQLGVPSVGKLDEETKAALASLENLGIQLFDLDASWKVAGASLVAQFSTSLGNLCLLSTSEGGAMPGPSWLEASNSGTWVASSSLPRAPTARIQIQSHVSERAGASVLEINRELDGPVTGLGARWEKLLADKSPQLAALIQGDDPTLVSYSDRYLKSPWSVVLLGSFLQVFKGESLTGVKIQTVEPAGSQPGYLFNHDWLHVRDLATVLPRWLERSLRVPVEVEIKPHTRDLQHSRVLTIDWASGVKSKIILDQGMGYWRVRDQARFDFSLNPEGQVTRMAERLMSATMVQSGSWPTYMTVMAATR